MQGNIAEILLGLEHRRTRAAYALALNDKAATQALRTALSAVENQLDLVAIASAYPDMRMRVIELEAYTTLMRLDGVGLLIHFAWRT